MTTKYANLKPMSMDSNAISGNIAVLKWSHSIVEEYNFINEYAAIENARSLAFELGSYNGVFCDTKPWTITSRTPSSRRSLGFASDVDVLMGLADEITMYKVTVPELCLGNGIMPWSAGLLRGGDFAVPTQDIHEEHLHGPGDNSSMTHASGTSGDTTFEAATLPPTSVPASNFGHDHPANAQTGSQIPSWGHNILQLLEEEGVVEDEEDGPVIMVSSFYIDHETHRFHDEPRILRFDHDYEEWEADVRFIWEGMVDNQAPLDIVIVRPEPPHIPFRGTVATVIVHQHQRPDRAACLITAVHIMDPVTTFRHSAHSTDLLLPHARVRQLAGVDHICLQREEQGAGQCTIHIGHQLQPADQDIAILHGLSLHVRIPSTLSIEEAEQNLCRRVQQYRRQRSGHSWDPPDSQEGPPEDDHPLPVDGTHDPEDAISFMGKRPARSSRHRPIEISSSSTSPETISSLDNGLRWRQTVIFTMDGLSTSAQLPWSDSDALFSQIAAALNIARRDILRVVAVPHRPPDYGPVNLHCMLLQKSTEFRPTPYVRLVLVDRELHVEQNVQTSPFRRFPTWIPHVLTRTRLLTELGLGDLCDLQGSPCHVWKNNVLIEEHSTTRLEIADGDYIRLYVGDLEGHDTCLSDLDLRFSEGAEEEAITDDVDDASLFQKAMRQLEQACSKTLRDFEPHTCRIAPDHVTAGRPLGLPGPAAHQEQRPTAPIQDFHQGDFQRLGTWFDRDSLIECSDEGAIAYIDTWYIHHQHQSICRESRPFRLGDDPTRWRTDILDLWQDVIDPSMATVIHLVQPPPPCAMTECVLAHLILEQSKRPQHGVGLITIHVRDRHGDTTRHGAYSLPNIMTERNVLQLAEMFIYCQARLCAVRLGALPFGLADWVEIPRAASLVIHIRPLIMPTEEDDHMELMQRPNTRWRRQTVPEEGLATSSTARRCARFAFNPGAPVFNPMVPNLNTMSEEIQELHQHWLRTAFSWEGETASTRIQTWFVDQHDQNFWTCTRPRTVRLYEDYTQWEAQIRQTWQDLLNPAAPSIIQIVTPTPVNTNRETAAHVLLIQRPHEVFATVLTTVVDHSHARRAITMQLAITTHEHMYVQNLLMALGLAGRCLVTGAPMTCQTWYDRYLIQPGTVFPARNGQGLLIQMHRRPTFQNIRDGTNLLQTGVHVFRRERQTHGQVAHTHGPRSDTSTCAPSILEEDMEPPCPATGIIYIHWPPTYRSSTQIPHFVEVEVPGTPEQVRQELRSMGYEGEAFSCGQHDAVYFHPCIFHHEMMHIYCNQDTTAKNGIHVQRGTPADDDITHMKILHRKGFHKAVITQREQVNDYVTILHFCNVEPKHEEDHRPPRLPTPWPSPQPIQINMTTPFSVKGFDRPRSDYVIEVDCQELQAFFNAPPLQLITDITPYEVPDFIQEAIAQCRPLSRHDRLIIYADGSSQSKKRHCSPLWTDLHEVSDSWCFAVFAEQYPDQDDDSGRNLEFIGLTCQQILYEPDRPHHVGTDHIGSDAAETEALLWSALWRLAQNHRLPTTFVTDSLLVGGQASGTLGTSSPSTPFGHLRAAFQALEAILPEDHLRVSHTRSHAGEPYNELVDHFAKLEGRDSQYLPRQQINMPTFGRILRVLWMMLAQDGDLPRSCEGGLAIPPPKLPDDASPIVPITDARTVRTDVALSFATANVRTFYKGTDGTPGKLHYVREQFKHLHLHFLGLQETRTTTCSTTTASVLRLASGDHQGHQGVELWVNLNQPYGWQNGRPLYFTKNDIVVTFASPRCMLAHVHNLQLDFMVAVIYAPQSGISHSERADWWNDTMISIQDAVQDKDLVLLIDANAASGAQDARHVFQQDDKSTSGTGFLRDLLETHRLCLPATSDRHQGDHQTWLCPATQQGHRIDYVAIPISWFPSCTTSRTIPELDLGNIGDHTAVGLEVQWYQFSSHSPSNGHSARCYDRTAIPHSTLAKQLRGYVPLEWEADIATQVDHCNQHLVQTLQSHCPKRTTGPKKPFITEEMWALRAQKLQAGRRLRQLRRMQAREALVRVFACWKHPEIDVPGETFAISLQCAFLKHGVQFQRSNFALRRALRKARGQALHDAVLALPPECHASDILQALKPLIGPTNMRHRREMPLPMVNDEDGRPCRTPQDLTDRWANFFGAMEGGTRMDERQLRNLWKQNLQACIPAGLCLQPEDIPTLADLERAFRRVRPGKAIGADDIPPELCHCQPVTMARLTYTQMLKLLAHGQEALLHKGGLLVSAWKRKGAQQECSSYRSLLISSHVGKTLHRVIREQQSSLYECFLQRSQIGGRKQVPVGLGVHHVRATLRRAKQQRESSGLIFLDLQEAFYRVIRPLAVGGTLPDAVLGQIAARLNLDDQVLHDLHELLQSPSATELAGLPQHLQVALRAGIAH
jgi:ribonuclease HI